MRDDSTVLYKAVGVVILETAIRFIGKDYLCHCRHQYLGKKCVVGNKK